MVGYVKIYKPELRVREYELYRGLYCSLCKALSKYFGVFSRLILSYDVTFLILVLMASRGITPDFEKGVCPFNVSKRCLYCRNSVDEFRYGAAISVLLFYHKVQDNLADGTFFKRLLMRFIIPYARHLYKKACKMYPEIALEISVLMKEQAKIEESNTADIDLSADSSAKALGLIFDAQNNNPSLRSFGYSVGRWVYLVDAAEDVCEDIKNNSFNVFANKYNIKSPNDYTQEIQSEIKKSLNLSLLSAVNECQNINSALLLPIIQNIICDGTDSVMQNIFSSNNTKK